MCLHLQILGDLLGSFSAGLVESPEILAKHVPQDTHVMLAKSSGSNDANSNARAQSTTPRPLSSRNRSRSWTSGKGFRSVAARCLACERFSSERKNKRYARLSSRTTSSGKLF